MKRLSILGIIVGVLVTGALDMIIAVVAAVFVVSSIQNKGMTHDQAKDAVAAVALTPGFLGLYVVVGTLATIAGCYVAARIGKQAPYLNSAIVGAVGAAFGVALASGYPLWFNIVSFALLIPAVLLGARLARPRPAKNA